MLLSIPPQPTPLSHLTLCFSLTLSLSPFHPQAVLLAALMCFSLFSSLRHTPFLNVATNVFKAGLYGILAWSSIVLVVLELTVSYGPDPVKAARTLSAVCGYGLAPAFVLAGLAMYLR